MKKEEIIEKLTEIRNKRNCNCSASKVAERAYFDRVISELKSLSEDDHVLPYLEKAQNAVPIRNDETRIRFNVYGYAINVAKRVYGA